jgi:hypothetical protein
MSEKTPDQIKEDLRSFIGFVTMSLQMSNIEMPEADKIQFAILAKKEDGSGKVVASFDCEEFLQDLEALIGNPQKELIEEVKDEIEKAKADKIP